MKKILELQKITKRFGNVTVLDDIDFELYEGEVHAILGQNGAGKSVLMKILNGVYKKDTGTIKIDNEEVNFSTPMEAKKLGISMVYQEFSLVPHLSVTQNVFLSNERKNFKIFLNDKKCESDAVKIIKELDVQISPQELVKNLDVGKMQIVEIAKALVKNAKILIFDEPTSSLSNKEIERLFELIKNLKEKKVSIIFITHHMGEVFKICDRVTVLKDGKKIFTKKIEEIDLDILINAMIGEKARNIYKKNNTTNYNLKPILEVSNLKGQKFDNISFKLWPKEILGIAGLMGSGKTEILKTLFGILKKSGGDIFLNGKKVNIKNSTEAIDLGIFLVPENRRVEGLVVDYSIKENILLPILRKITNFKLINDRKGSIIAKEKFEKLNIKSMGLFQLVKFLSGGNQQKVVFAKSLATNPDVLLLDDPTVGIDVNAKLELMEIVSNYANDNNKSAIFVSSEFIELLQFCDRIIILKKGEIVNTISENIQEFSEEMLLKMVQ
jgi:ribose transport system ATP-binding protein